MQPKPSPKVYKPSIEDEDETYTKTHWDHFARHVRFTVTQEAQLKNILTKERDRILTARSDTAEAILKVLTPEQKAKWDRLYSRADKSGNYGDYKKRLLLQPHYLGTVFKLNAKQRKQIFYAAWTYARRVEKIRKRDRLKIQKLLRPYQFVKWESVTRLRIGKPNIK